MLQEEQPCSVSTARSIWWVLAEEGRDSDKGGKATIRIGLRGERLPGINDKGMVAVTGEYVEIYLVRQGQEKVIISIKRLNPISSEEVHIYDYKGDYKEVELSKILHKYQVAVNAAFERSKSAAKNSKWYFYEKRE